MMEELQFGTYYGALYRKTQSYLRAAVSEKQVTFSDSIILLYVYGNPGIIQDQIACGLSIDKTVVTRSLKILMKLGYVKKVEDPENQRVKRIYVTELAEEFLCFWRKIVDQWNHSILSDLNSEERDIVVSAMKKIKDKAVLLNIEEQIKEATSQ